MRSRIPQKNRHRLGALVIAAAAVVAVMIAVTRPHADAPAAPPAQRAQVAAQFAGLPQHGTTLGSPSAPATLIEFADLQCPYCGVFARDVLPSVIARYVRTGRLRLELNVLAFVGPDSVRAGRMAATAAGQDRLWTFADAFYRDQGEENTGYATDEFLARVGEVAGLDAGGRDAAEQALGLRAAEQAAQRLGVRSTPSFFVRAGDGGARPVTPSALTPEAFGAALDAALGAR